MFLPEDDLQLQECALHFFKQSFDGIEQKIFLVKGKSGNEKLKAIRYLKNPIETGAENRVYFGFIRGRDQALKKIVFSQMLERESFEKFPELMIREASCPKEARIGPKMYLLEDGDTIRRYAENRDLLHCFATILKEDRVSFAKHIMIESMNKCLLLWEAGFVHGDIKHQNFLVEKNFNVLLTDFGWSKKWHSDRGRAYKLGDVNVFHSLPSWTERKLYFANPLTLDIRGLGCVFLGLWVNLRPILTQAGIDVVQSAARKVPPLSQNMLKKIERDKMQPYFLAMFFNHILKKDREGILGKIENLQIRFLIDRMVYNPEAVTIPYLKVELENLVASRAEFCEKSQKTEEERAGAAAFE